MAADHVIPASTLSAILKRKDDVIHAKERQGEKLVEVQFRCFEDMTAKDVQRKSGTTKSAVSPVFDDFKASSGWLIIFTVDF